MRSTFEMLGGLGLGAGLMSYFDPFRLRDGRVPCVEVVDGFAREKDRSINYASMRGVASHSSCGLLKGHWSPPLRRCAGSIGLILMANCLVRRDLSSMLLG